MERVTGIGGVFIKAKDQQSLLDWYSRHLGLAPLQGETWVVLRWAQDPAAHGGSTTWAVFPEASDYFGPGDARSMVNYRVADLDRMLAQLRAAGVRVDDRVAEHAAGRFGWAADPEGNRFELWQPPEGE